MPTSVRGNSERGFTLVEVLVVLVIVAIAASMVSLSIGKGADPLRADAQRLADAFTVAEGEARSDGRPIRWLPASGGWLLERPIAGSDYRDAMGCYPLFVCRDWGGLAADLEPLRHELVSLALVTDPFGQYDEALLHGCFDVVMPFKPHFVADLSQPITTA